MTVETTTADLARGYDKLIRLLEKKIDDGSISGTEISEYRKLLDAAAILGLARASTPEGKITGAIKPADLPFPAAIEDAPELLRV